MRYQAALTLALSSVVSGHFLLKNPATLGFSDDDEGTFPCGGFAISFDNTTDFPVSGGPVYLQSTHPEATWLIRAALSNDTSTWHNLLPVIEQEGLGDFCEKSVPVPDSWAGQTGVIQIIQDATDGFLYQCAAVNFTSSGTATDTTCKNASSTTAKFDASKTLDIPSGNSSTATSSSSASSASSTSSGNAASTLGAPGAMMAGVVGVLSWLALC